MEKELKTTLVIGASTNPTRYSNIATLRLHALGHHTIALGLKEGVIGDVPIWTSLPDDIEVDTVTMYVGPQHQSSYYEMIVELKPRRVIFNPGTENPEFYKLLKDHNIEVDIACTLVLLSTGMY